MTRQARVRALAKINLDLQVIHRRPDGYHELRTVFQTISVADTLDIRLTPARRTSLTLRGNVDIPGNLVLRAAEACLDEMKLAARVEFGLRKAIPMGAGLGGGSSDAAAVLLALPALALRVVPLERMLELARELGSDVPFFLLGGTAVGLGRGAELYPLPDLPRHAGLVVAPGVHVSTVEAYRALGRGLTSEPAQNTIDSFQSRVWQAGGGSGSNDFESVVFAQYPRLGEIKRKLERLGADRAMMSGSGSSVFGLFRTKAQVNRARQSFEEMVFPISLVSRVHYRSLWRRWLQHLNLANAWPPRSRSAR